MSWLPFRSLVPTGLLLSAACLAGNAHGPSSDERTSPKRVLSGTDTLAVESDAYLGPDGDDYWKGTTDSLVVDGVRSTRILIRANQAAIEEAIGNGTLASATLELTVQTAGASWPTGGATVDAHRVLQHWTEAEVTWVCADGHEGWDMSTGSGSIWHAAHTARTTISNGQTGVVRLNVTADVAAFLSAPQSNHGWLIKRTSEGVGEPGRIAFASRETTPQPRLIIEVESDTTPPAIPPTVSLPDDPRRISSTPGSPISYYRVYAELVFRQTATGAEIRSVLERHQATIVGGVPRLRMYIVEYPDPGDSWSALMTRIQALWAEPTVEYASPLSRDEGNPVLYARLPNDGQNLRREAWLANSDSTWAMRAIRAPLAWGCETGMYGSTRPRVGLVEFDIVQDPDLANSILTQPWSANIFGAGTITTAQAQSLRDHGTMTAGVLTAEGDNNRGIAGVAWETDLRVYRLRGENDPFLANGPARTAFMQAMDKVRDDNVQVLSLSLDLFTDPTEPLGEAQRQFLRTKVKELLDARPELIVVRAIGNDGVQNYTTQSYLTSPNRHRFSLGVVIASLRAESPSYASRILVVAGSAPTGGLWQGSNFVSGATDIVAPAQNVAVLDSVLGNIRLENGTSLATPLVAGVAAQLRAMDPTLSAAQVKDYILRGATATRIDLTTGAEVVPQPVVQGVYQLDAYGSLTLLSRERQGTPLCGLETVYRFNPTQGTYSVTANRQAPELIISNAPPPTFTDGFSVAQGGRLLAIANQPYRLQNGTWTAVSPIANVDQVVYLERDIVYLRIATSGSGVGTRSDLFARLNQGGEQQVTAGLPSGLWSPGFSASVSGISPTGDFLHFGWEYGDGDFCNLLSITGGGEYLARLRTGGRQVLNEWFRPECATPSPITGAPERSIVAWRRDGTEMMRAVTVVGASEFHLKRYQVSTNASLFSTGPTFAGYRPGDIHWSPEGGRVTLHEHETGSPACQLAIRRVGAPHALIEPAIPLSQEACFWVPRLVPLRGRLMATLANRTVSTPRGAQAGLTRASRAELPAEFRMRAN